MKRVLIVCNTYFQLIAAIQLKQTLKKEEEVYLVLSDHSKNAENICERLKEQCFFKDIWFFDTKKLVKHRNMFDTIKNIWLGCFGRNLLNIDKKLCFDEIIGYNLDIPSHFLYAYLKRKNKNMICNRFEEGLFSYHTLPDDCRELKIIYKIRKFFKKQNMREEPKVFYCFHPSLYKGSLEPIQIPRLFKDDITIKKLLTNIFQIKEGQESGYKYLYLPCIYDMEGGEPIGEFRLAEKIAATVGKNNLLVKVHPREDQTKYVEAGFHVEKSSSIPLEALMIAGKYQNMVFLTSLSGSILTVSNILELRLEAYYLYALCDLTNNSMAQHYSKVLEGYLSEKSLKLDNIRIVTDLQDILKEKIYE